MTNPSPTTTTNPQCRAFVHDDSLPTNSSQVRQCRNHTDGAKFCTTHTPGVSRFNAKYDGGAGGAELAR